MLSPAAVADLLRAAEERSPQRFRGIGNLRFAVLDVVRTRGPVRAKHVAEAVNRTCPQIACVLSRLAAEGAIERVRHGVYA